MRLNKFISESGLCSRREADKLIEEGFVLVNGKQPQMGDQVKATDKVTVRGKRIEAKLPEESIYIAFNKPIGITSTTEPSVRGNIIRYINHSQRIFPIGRLDKDSQGLILLTNDGDIVNKILRSENNHDKEYLVTVNKVITDAFIHDMAHGVPILGEVTRKCTVVKETPFIFRITIKQGLNRQIRRMCEYFGYEATKLERIRVLNIRIDGLESGAWRELTSAEQTELLELVKDSPQGTKRQKGFMFKKKGGGKPKSDEVKAKESGVKAKPSKALKPSKSAKPARPPKKVTGPRVGKSKLSKTITKRTTRKRG